MMSSDTTLEEVQGFVKKRFRNPYIMEGKVIWNFSNHQPNMEALEFATKNKLEKDRYLIPFQVTGTWGFMMQLLPKEIKEIEILVYKPQFEDYAAYTNLRAEMSDDEIEDFRGTLREDLRDIAEFT